MCPPIEMPGMRKVIAEVEEDGRPEARLHRVDAAGAQGDDAAAHQAEHRARRADGLDERAGRHQGADRAASSETK